MARIFDFVRKLPGLRPRGTSLDILEKNNIFCAKLDQNSPLDSYTYTVVDTELTGLSARKEEIVSLGAVRIQGLSIRPGDSFSALVRPSIALPKTSTLIHRITPGAIAQAPPLAQVLPKFIDFCSGTLIIGHNVGLDMAFINRACKKYFGQPMVNPCLDTMRMAMLWREQQLTNHYDRFNLKVSYSLADLAKELELPAFTAHTALGDALQTAYLFLYLAKKVAGHGSWTLKKLHQAGQSWRWYF